MNSTVDFEISVNVETISIEQFNALVTLFGLRETLLRVRNSGKTSVAEKVESKAAETAPTEASGESKTSEIPFGAVAARETTKEPENALKSLEKEDVVVETVNVEQSKPTFVNPFDKKPVAPKPTATAAPLNPFAKKDVDMPKAPTAPVNPFAAKAPVNPFAAKNVPTPPQQAAPQPVEEAKVDVAKQGQSILKSDFPVSDRVTFDPSGSRFMVDGTEISEMAVRMQAGLLTMKPDKMAALKERLAAMGYTDIVSLVNAWNTSHDAREAAHIYEFIRSMLV